MYGKNDQQSVQNSPFVFQESKFEHEGEINDDWWVNFKELVIISYITLKITVLIVYYTNGQITNSLCQRKPSFGGYM